MDMEGAIRQLQEAAIVTAGIESLHAERLKTHEEWLEHQEKWMTRHAEAMAELDAAIDRHEKWFAKSDQTMAEIQDKLNALIAVVDDLVRNPRNGRPL